jgi:nicotinamidase-related amidase
MKKGTALCSLVPLALLLFLTLIPYQRVSAASETIIDEWETISPPAAPRLAPVIIDPRTSAFLILDIQSQMCTPEQRPRCAASVPKIASFLLDARARAMPIVYSLTPTGSVDDIVPVLAPMLDEPYVSSSVDKFYNTGLEKILKDKGVKTVIIVGTAANGAVLHTATGAAMRGLQVIIPVDGMSAVEPYAEQYTAWHMLNAPGTRNRATLTAFDIISFQ